MLKFIGPNKLTQDNRSKTVVKIHTKVLCTDVEYKSLSITNETSCRDVVKMLLNKFRLKHRDPNLFYLTMEVWTRQSGIPIKSVVVLDEDDCPSQLLACYSSKDLKFSLMMRRGGLIKVYDSCLMSESLYKSLQLSQQTTVAELVQLLLHCYNSKERTSRFSLYEVCPSRNYERRLHSQEIPLTVQAEWPNPDLYVFQLRKNNDEDLQKTKNKLPWTKTFDSLTGNFMFHLNSKDEVTSSSIHSPTLKPYFNNYDNYFYI